MVFKIFFPSFLKILVLLNLSADLEPNKNWKKPWTIENNKNA